MIGQLLKKLWAAAFAAMLCCGVDTGDAAAETLLVMAEQHGCFYCERWNAEVSPEYSKTAEGRAAPLLRVDIHQALPEDLSFEAPLRITPTFVLMRYGREVSRLEGYPGEGFFWGLLQRMLTNAEVPYGGSG